MTMTQTECRQTMIRYLLQEQPRYRDLAVPTEERGQKLLLRALMNVRHPAQIATEFLEIQDTYLQKATQEKGIVDLADLKPIQKGIYLWRGDITRLRCGAIVNAANSGMTGCYVPNHRCVDNCIHTYAGVQLRLACAQMMYLQGHEEETGKAKITPAFNLPCDYVLHTVGPIISGRLTNKDCDLLASCYRSCLELAEEKGVKSIAFCCISTGEFHFPNDKAAQIAVQTVKDYMAQINSNIEVIFNVFKEIDERLYRGLLSRN